MQPTNIYFLISCEHGGNRIPLRYRSLFEGYEHLLHSHRGYDSGALSMAKKLAMRLHSPLFVATTSRLLIDLNRSIGHPRLYSEATRHTPAAIRHEILKYHYLPYRTLVEANIADAIRSGLRVIHISSHSFTPELNGEVRNTDIGLLYDPSRPLEQELCNRWRTCLGTHVPDLRVRRNYPYTGSANGFPTHLRRRFSADAYVGIELEVNQKHILKGGWRWHALRNLLADTLNEIVA
jgi:predicted N-formylglutamate amidohydrolase